MAQLVITVDGDPVRTVIGPVSGSPAGHDHTAFRLPPAEHVVVDLVFRDINGAILQDLYRTGQDKLIGVIISGAQVAKGVLP